MCICKYIYNLSSFLHLSIKMIPLHCSEYIGGYKIIISIMNYNRFDEINNGVLHECLVLKSQLLHAKKQNQRLYWSLISQLVDNNFYHHTDGEQQQQQQQTFDERELWYNISMNSNVTMDMIRKYNDKPWIRDAIFCNPNLDLQYVVDTITELQLNKKNKDQTTKVITDGWYRYRAACTLPLSVIDDNKAQYPWLCHDTGLSSNPQLTEIYINSHPEVGWRWSQIISNNTNISTNYIETCVINKHIDDQNKKQNVNQGTNYQQQQQDINWRLVSGRNPNVDVDYIEQHRQRNWNWELLSSTVPIQQILSKPHLPWTSDGMSLNPTVTLDIVEHNRHYSWDWNKLSMVIPFDVIMNRPDLPWTSSGVSWNTSLPISFVIDSINDINNKWVWDWNHITLNTFDYNINKLETQYCNQINKLAKTFYWSCVRSMSKPPFGYYFLNDIENSGVIPDHNKLLFKQLREHRNFESIYNTLFT